MSDRIRVLEIANNWGIGGTALDYYVRAKGLNRSLFDVVAAGYEGGGPWLDRAAASGLRTEAIGLDDARMEAVISSFRPHLIHWLRVTTQNALLPRLQRLGRKYGVAVEVETNVFGRPALDPDLNPPALTRHVSRTSMLRCAGLLRTTAADLFSRGHRVVYNPLPLAEMPAPDASVRAEHRHRLGVQPDELLAIRVGRADLRKWGRRLEMAVPHLLAAVPNLKLAFLSAPDEIAAGLTRRFGSRLTVLPETADATTITSLYQASDLMVHSSDIGESFGYTLAEAMHWQKPVVVDGTPDMDNAQVEVVDHGETGYVVRSTAGFVEAVKLLAADPELRRRMGAVGRERVLARFAETRIVPQWEKHYIELLDRAGCDAVTPDRRAYAAALPDSGMDERAYPAEYDARCANTLGPPPSLGEKMRLAVAHAAGTLAFAHRIGLKRVWTAVRDRLRAGHLFRRA